MRNPIKNIRPNRGAQGGGGELQPTGKDAEVRFELEPEKLREIQEQGKRAGFRPGREREK